MELSEAELARLMLGRITYGPSERDRARLREEGTAQYLENQLKPDNEDDTLVKEKLDAVRIPVETGRKGKQKVESRPLKWLYAPQEEIMANMLAQGEELPEEERLLPFREVVTATWIRAAYSKWQLREMMVEFWHNHFNVSVSSFDVMPVVMPAYDRLMRTHCLGNFKSLLTGVAKSPAMLYYLDNHKSKASPANENFARELFELHTLGADHYLNNLYNRWREVPGALEGKPAGYIDEDVYEAARAFTGWTVADGRDNEKGGEFPATGHFHYFDGWHDNYQKRVLGVEFPPNQAPTADGMQVLDLVARHPGTARHLVEKLCRRFVEDEPSASLIERAAAVWMEQQDSPDQIARVMEVILTSSAFRASSGKKVKRPYELLVSLFRGLDCNFSVKEELYYLLRSMGYFQFDWVTPTGHPDKADYWLNSNMMLKRWNVVTALCSWDWHKITDLNYIDQVPGDRQTVAEITDYWLERMLTAPASRTLRERAIQYFAAGGIEEEPPYGEPEGIRYRHYNLISLIAMSPEFQYR